MSAESASPKGAPSPGVARRSRTPPPAPPRRREEAKALFRNAILEAAEQVFAERGFHGAHVQAIAGRARMAVGTIYNHFQQKEDILCALLEERSDELLGLLAAHPSDPGDFEAKLTARLTRVLRYIDAHRSFYALALEHGLVGGSATGGADSSLDGKCRRRVNKFRAAFRALVEEGVSSGALGAMDATRLTWFLGGAMRAFLVGALEDESSRLEDEAPHIVSLFLDGARSASPARASRPAGRPPVAPARRAR